LRDKDCKNIGQIVVEGLIIVESCNIRGVFFGIQAFAGN
jgi:hypothetical protein